MQIFDVGRPITAVAEGGNRSWRGPAHGTPPHLNLLGDILVSMIPMPSPVPTNLKKSLIR